MTPCREGSSRAAVSGRKTGRVGPAGKPVSGSQAERQARAGQAVRQGRAGPAGQAARRDPPRQPAHAVPRGGAAPAFLAVLAVLAVLCLGGCLGKTPPVEHYLRVSGPACPRAEQGGAARPVLALKPLRAPDILDRSAVLVIEDRVLTPSLRWYWEGPPTELAGGALLAALECRGGVAAVSPYSPRLTHDAVLSGRLSAFNVVKSGQSLTFVAAGRVEAWSRRGEALLGATDIEVARPVSAPEAPAVARAAEEALTAWAEAVADWVGSMGTALGRAAKNDPKDGPPAR